jgi:hypothetical protein
MVYSELGDIDQAVQLMNKRVVFENGIDHLDAKDHTEIIKRMRESKK